MSTKRFHLLKRIRDEWTILRGNTHKDTVTDVAKRYEGWTTANLEHQLRSLVHQRLAMEEGV